MHTVAKIQATKRANDDILLLISVEHGSELRTLSDQNLLLLYLGLTTLYLNYEIIL